MSRAVTGGHALTHARTWSLRGGAGADALSAPKHPAPEKRVVNLGPVCRPHRGGQQRALWALDAPVLSWRWSGSRDAGLPGRSFRGPRCVNAHPSRANLRPGPSRASSFVHPSTQNDPKLGGCLLSHGPCIRGWSPETKELR